MNLFYYYSKKTKGYVDVMKFRDEDRYLINTKTSSFDCDGEFLERYLESSEFILVSEIAKDGQAVFVQEEFKWIDDGEEIKIIKKPLREPGKDAIRNLLFAEDRRDRCVVQSGGTLSANDEQRVPPV